MQNNIFAVTLTRNEIPYMKIQTHIEVTAGSLIDHIYNNYHIACFLRFGTKNLRYNDKIFDICGSENAELEFVCSD